MPAVLWQRHAVIMKTRVAPPLPARFAVLADIHGNSSALRAVLDDIARYRVSSVLVLGDHFSGPLDPAGTAAHLLGLPAYCLRGNHDRYLLEQDRARMGPSDQVAFDALDAAALAWVAELPEVLDFGDVWACHATPLADDVYWTHRVDAAGNLLPRGIEEVAEWARGVTASLLLCAHTHLPTLWHLPGGQVLLNPGSVGCPAYDDTTPVPHKVETRTPAATWALVSRDGAGWHVAHHHVLYDTRDMVARARSNGREDWARAVAVGRL